MERRLQPMADHVVREAHGKKEEREHPDRPQLLRRTIPKEEEHPAFTRSPSPNRSSQNWQHAVHQGYPDRDETGQMRPSQSSIWSVLPFVSTLPDRPQRIPDSRRLRENGKGRDAERGFLRDEIGKTEKPPSREKRRCSLDNSLPRYRPSRPGNRAATRRWKSIVREPRRSPRRCASVRLQKRN